jgi:hypothetical protein
MPFAIHRHDTLRLGMPAAPVTLLIYNRPELTRLALDSIRAHRPGQLIVVADAPRSGNARDAQRCDETRRVIAEVDWPCELTTDYAAVHMGCAARVASGITQVLSRFPATIVIEDDCVADSSFFRYADELLERYAGDERLFAISGDNFEVASSAESASYFFSRYAHIWGWATWSRAWRHYDPSMAEWEGLRDSGWLERLFDRDPSAARYWRDVFDRTARGEIDSWAYRWLLACWRHDGLTAIPARNVVSNTGFSGGPFARQPVTPMQFPMRHPTRVERSIEADRATQKWVFEHPRLLRLRRMLVRRRSAAARATTAPA